MDTQTVSAKISQLFGPENPDLIRGFDNFLPAATNPVYIYVCICCIYFNLYVFHCIYISIHVICVVYIFQCVCVCDCVCVCVCVCLCLCLCMCMCMCVYTCIHTYVYTYIHTYIQIYIQIYTYQGQRPRTPPQSSIAVWGGGGSDAYGGLSRALPSPGMSGRPLTAAAAIASVPRSLQVCVCVCVCVLCVCSI